ncbi:MAG TPA: hypothetical protein DEQ80_11455 [Anaerolinea thermolimosa]|uniref:Uncharacterized protein n=1 Tax=Anaerolinea thermolimosa TaxID=229919 RepID=A0A3D1JJP9_9CHLR|nr:hypothetical protein [Anaerolinea thermolimosa]
MKARPATIPLGLTLLVMDSLIWLILGVLIATGLHPSLPDPLWIRVAMVILSWMAAAALLAAYLGLTRHMRLAYPWAILSLAIASLTIIFDDFGLSDLIVLILHLMPLALLIKDHAWYAPRTEAVAR